jgi:hypothetical protein
MASDIPDDENDDDVSQGPLPQSRKRALINARENKSKKKSRYYSYHSGLITRLVLTYLDRTTPLDPFITAARWIGRSQDPFINFFALFQAKYDDDTADPGDEELKS